MIPRIMIAAPMSGCGKTTVACGLMQALADSGYRVAAAKCGPDYIDPMFHRKVLGMDSMNLDLFFCGPGIMKQLFARHTAGADIAVIEGVMGYYDGMALDSEKASSYEVAKVLDIPVLLVVDAKGAALSVLAVLKGFLTFRGDHHIAGIILNRTSEMSYPRMKDMIEQGLLEMGYHIPVVGCVPEDPLFGVESRHLGLVAPDEILGIQTALKQMGDKLSKTVDLNLIIKIARSAGPLLVSSEEVLLPADIFGERTHTVWTGTSAKALPPPDISGESRGRLAVARDSAFGFYYKENLELLQQLGCELVFFSPIEDESLPPGIGGLLLGGGYPELHAKELSANVRLRREIKSLLKRGLPCHAECGGFMYLHERMEGMDGRFYEMTGLIEGDAFKKKRLVRFGYVQIEAAKDGAYLKKSEVLRGHEFHYWDSQNNGSGCIARKPGRDVLWDCIHMEGNVFAGFPHIHYYSNVRFARRFVDKMKEYSKESRR